MKPTRLTRGRAHTPAQKREVLDRVYWAWLNAPEERLAQLLINAVAAHSISPPYYTEDAQLLDALEQRLTKAGVL